MNADAADAPARRILVRPMRVPDLEQVMNLAGSLKEAPCWPRTVYLAALDRDAVPGRIALVAEAEEPGKVTGFAVASLLPPQAELETIAVVADGQRRGAGRLLMHEMAGKLKQAGVREATLEVRASNRKALGFYRALGWSETGRRPRYYADPEEDAVLMSLAIK